MKRTQTIKTITSIVAITLPNIPIMDWKITVCLMIIVCIVMKIILGVQLGREVLEDPEDLGLPSVAIKV